MKIAVIGAGIAGLTAAHRLRARHDLTIFEAERSPGGHAHTVDVELDGERHAVDTGFIVFNHANYPLFTALLEELGVASRPTVMSFSVRCDRTGLEYGSATLNTVFADRTNVLRPGFLRMVGEIRRFHREAGVEALPPDRETVAAYVAARGYSQRFLDHFLVPLGAALWSSPPHRFLDFPMRFVIEFLGNHGMLQMAGSPTWRVVAGGSRTYVDAIARGLDGRIRLGTPIARVERHPGGVRVVDRTGADAAFDHVVLACHADQALAMLADPRPVERELLGMFPYQRNDVVLHTDTSTLPRRRRAWSSWNYHVPHEPRETVSVTYNMNRLQSLTTPRPVNVTLNDSGLVDDEHVLGRFVYDHPQFIPGRAAAERRHRELVAAHRSSFCGAYWGFGFHEDGVRSGTAVARAIEALDRR